jgi:hypothetical protein
MLAGSARIEPSGSMAMILTLGFFSLIFLEMPVRVPPVPAPRKM